MNLIALLTECYLTEGYPEAQRDFSLVAASDEVATTIAAYKDLVNRNQVQGNERNIDYWRKQGWEQFTQFVATKSQQKSKTQAKRSKTSGKSIILEETPEWLIVIPLDKDASCYHGKNTDWCTTKPNANQFENYFYNKDVILVYFLQIQTGKKWAIACHNTTDVMELFDQQDKSINRTEFHVQTGLDPEKYRTQAIITAGSAPSFVSAKHKYNEMLNIVENAKPFEDVDPRVEQALLFVKNYEDILAYCIEVKGEWPEAERMLIRDVDSIQAYAKYVLEGRWLKAEPIILTKGPTVVFDYAKAVVNQRWPEAEPVLVKDPKLALEYVREISHERFPELEPYLLANSTGLHLVNYAMKMIKGRWPEAEPTILKDPDTAYAYIRDVIKGEWPEAEPILLTQPHEALSYVTVITHRRWPELEPLIGNSNEYMKEYVLALVKADPANVKLADELLRKYNVTWPG